MLLCGCSPNIKKNTDYNDKMAECVHVPKLNEIHTGQASSCAVLTTIAFLP